jgi:hypothetical protein
MGFDGNIFDRGAFETLSGETLFITDAGGLRNDNGDGMSHLIPFFLRCRAVIINYMSCLVFCLTESGIARPVLDDKAKESSDDRNTYFYLVLCINNALFILNINCKQLNYKIKILSRGKPFVVSSFRT